jgi:hypothetical protein
MTALRLFIADGFAVSVLGLAPTTEDRLWRGVGVILGALSLALALAYLFGWN